MKPAHAVYFAAVTAEEQGLLGSEYLGMHPPIPAGEISLPHLNFDMLMPLGIPLSAQVGGAERTTFYPVVEKTAQAFHLESSAGPKTPGGDTTTARTTSAWQGLGFRHFPLGQGTLFEGTTPPGGWIRRRSL